MPAPLLHNRPIRKHDLQLHPVQLRVHDIQRERAPVDMLESQLRLPCLQDDEHMLECQFGGVRQLLQALDHQAVGDVYLQRSQFELLKNPWVIYDGASQDCVEQKG
jgi:hypothetical protein